MGASRLAYSVCMHAEEDECMHGTEVKSWLPSGSRQRKPCPLTLSVSFKHFIGCVKHLSLWGLWNCGREKGFGEEVGQVKWQGSFTTLWDGEGWSLSDTQINIHACVKSHSSAVVLYSQHGKETHLSRCAHWSVNQNSLDFRYYADDVKSSVATRGTCRLVTRSRFISTLLSFRLPYSLW